MGIFEDDVETTKQFRFSSKVDYEKALAAMIMQMDDAEEDTEEMDALYEELLEEYLQFCSDAHV